MNTFKLSNIPLDKMVWFLQHQGLKCISTEGGHAKYTRNDLRRPIIIQTHISPVPTFIVSQILKHLGFNKTSFHLYIKNYY
jgi:predicted RNA binding protein YcfA (HicA-like mRNA interferase family)